MTSGQAISKLKHDKKYTDDVIRPLEKEHKAFKIIKEKAVNVGTLIDSCNKDCWDEYEIKHYTPLRYYNVSCKLKCNLTQEEYDLLKEVLL